MVKKIILLLCATSTAMAQTTPVAAASVVTLSQKKVAELALQQGYRTKEVNLQYQQYKLPFAETLAKYDWLLGVTTGYELDKQAQLLSSQTLDPRNKIERYNTTLTLSKPFTTGTLATIELNRLSLNADYDTALTVQPPDNQTLDRAGIVLEQAILGNFFGVADRGTVNAAEENYKASEILRANDLENVVLESIRQFWTAYIAQENFKEAVSARDRYKKLVDTVRRKTSLGYSNPGDLPQAQAELETREQTVKSTSTEYLAAVENLLTSLALDPKSEVKFEMSTMLPAMPSLPPVKTEDLRAIRSQKLKVSAAEESLSASKSLAYPTLNVVGKAYTTGVAEKSEDSYSELTGGSRPDYYVGLRFAYNFGSDIQNERIVYNKLNRDLEQTRLQRQLVEVIDSNTQAERKAQAAYSIAQSAEKQKEFRERAVTELQRSYAQGRTDINNLIIALNSSFTAEVQYITAVGNYHIALNEWAASRDELIPDEQPSENGK
ncbi:TolC family protein [Bdellovibrio sp. SKB1291214]|uniref:TolC family protein n=1 Tax=Bdellovibrio sp. SKB1291214 TaxID=1732569 RepID=UPI000B51D771|nr:TolC family protein [Bdellovibrio sp. SKB1291214]UYL09803.1 TolC family protein [Bdellovibrio sp. SKB1291214]